MRRLTSFCLLVGLWLAAWLVSARALAVPGGRPSVEAIAPPSQLDVTPPALGAWLPPGEQAAEHLVVKNAGITATLHYTISVRPYARLDGIVDWLDAGPIYGTVAPRAQVTVGVTLTAQSYMWAGSFWTASLIVDSDSLAPPTTITVPVFLDVVKPVIEPGIAPAALSAAAPVGGRSCQTLTLTNQGNATLVFTLTLPADPAVRSVPWLSLLPSSGRVPPAGSRVISATFDAGRISSGSYSTHLTVESNSPTTPTIDVPVSLLVEPARLYLPLLFRGTLPGQAIEP